MSTTDERPDNADTDSSASNESLQASVQALIDQQEKTAARLERLVAHAEEGIAPQGHGMRGAFWVSVASLVLVVGMVLGVNELRSQVRRLHNQVRSIDAVLRRQASEQTKASPVVSDGVAAHVDAAVEAFRQELRTTMDGHRDDVLAREKTLSRREAVVEHRAETAEARIDAAAGEREAILDRAIGELNELAEGLDAGRPAPGGE